MTLFQKNPLYDQISNYSYDSVRHFLSSRKQGADPFLTNAFATMGTVIAATSNYVKVLERTLPNSLRKVNKNILALDALAYVVCSLQQAVRTAHRNDYSDEGLSRASLQLASAARIIKDHFIEEIDPKLGPGWLERWQEFRALEAPGERFHLLTYLLFTSKGHKVPMHRYPDSPPVILDLTLGLEVALAEFPNLKAILDAVEAFKQIGALMPDDDEP